MDGLTYRHTAPKAALVLDATGAPEVVIPFGALVLNGDYARVGRDLTLTGGAGERVVIKGFFVADPRPDLLTETGARLTANVAGRLAGGREAQGPVAPVGHYEGLQGEAWVVRENGRRLDLADGLEILPGDLLECGPGGSLHLNLLDGTRIDLGPDGRLLLDLADGERTVVSVLDGAFAVKPGETGDLSGGLVLELPTLMVEPFAARLAGRVGRDGSADELVLTGLLKADGYLVLTTAVGSWSLDRPGQVIEIASYFSEPQENHRLTQADLTAGFGRVVSGAALDRVGDNAQSFDLDLPPADAASAPPRPTSEDIANAMRAIREALTDSLPDLGDEPSGAFATDEGALMQADWAPPSVPRFDVVFAVAPAEQAAGRALQQAVARGAGLDQAFSEALEAARRVFIAAGATPDEAAQASSTAWAAFETAIGAGADTLSAFDEAMTAVAVGAPEPDLVSIPDPYLHTAARAEGYEAVEPRAELPWQKPFDEASFIGSAALAPSSDGVPDAAPVPGVTRSSLIQGAEVRATEDQAIDVDFTEAGEDDAPILDPNHSTPLKSPSSVGRVVSSSEFDPFGFGDDLSDPVPLPVAVREIPGTTFNDRRSNTTEEATSSTDASLILGSDQGETLTGRDSLDDSLYGFGGNDSLIGLGGNDTLVGGSGADVFVLEAKDAVSGIDRITDFDASEDILVLREGDTDFTGADRTLSDTADALEILELTDVILDDSPLDLGGATDASTGAALVVIGSSGSGGVDVWYTTAQEAATRSNSYQVATLDNVTVDDLTAANFQLKA
ncbi:MAG: hypothetical protein ACPGNT_08915 [Rhodospirillales bacterium]